MAKPLRILVDPSFLSSAWVAELQQQGHEVTVSEMADYDLILGPNCCRFIPGMEQFLPAIINRVRKVKYLMKGEEK